MLLFWRIRYLDSRDKTFKDRDLWLETDTLDPVMRAAVELCVDLKGSGCDPEMLRYRHLFREEKLSGDQLNALCERHGGMRSFCLPDYFEDEHSQALPRKRMAEVLTGDPNAVMFPAGARQHDIDYTFADKRPIPIDQITLSADDLRILGYFARDLREILSSAFFKDGPGTLTSVADAAPELQTAVTDEEIRSFVTIFRRLYMKGEPAGFLKAVEVFARVTQGYPLGGWITGVSAEYEAELGRRPDLVPYAGRENWPFTRKRLIDVFLYTQYAHQPKRTPKTKDDRELQYRDCLAAVGGRRALLTWLFLSAMWECSLHMRNAGVIIVDFFDRYCQVHGAACEVLVSVARDHPGIGQLEKKADRERRLFDEAVTRLAAQMWEEAGRPAGGSTQFQAEARARLAVAVAGGIGAGGNT